MGYPKIHLLYMAGKPVSLYVVKSPSICERWQWGNQEPSIGWDPMVESPKFGIMYQTIHSQNERPYKRVFEEDVDQEKLDKLIDQIKNRTELKDEIF